MNMQSVIATRRDAKPHTPAEMQYLALGAARGKIPDYQLAAWLMAAYLNPLDAQDTAYLTLAMAESGERLDLGGLPKPWVDKHSTGGVGDKTTIVVLPILAACGLTVIKMSGRGLGITGGTIDKLTAIPGFRLDMAPHQMIQQAQKIGLAITGQTPNLAPADKVLYALRDVTETVSSIPLIVSSILSKKIAGGAETIVLDVKCGSGAFMKTLDDAKKLAASLVATGKRCGVNVHASITDMDQPLGATIGNALEIREAIEVLTGEASGPCSDRFRQLCLELSAHTLVSCGKTQDVDTAMRQVTSAVESGVAAAKATAWIASQGGPKDLPSVIDALPVATYRKHVRAQASGWVSRINAEAFGRTVIQLGGGREKKDDVIDLSVGIELKVIVGSPVETGQILATVHAATQMQLDQALREVAAAIEIAEEHTATRPLFL